MGDCVVRRLIRGRKSYVKGHLLLIDHLTLTYARMPGMQPAEPLFTRNIPRGMSSVSCFPESQMANSNTPKYLQDAEATKPVKNNPSRVTPVWRAIKIARCLYLSDNHAKNIILMAYLGHQLPIQDMHATMPRITHRKNIWRRTLELKSANICPPERGPTSNSEFAIDHPMDRRMIVTKNLMTRDA